VFGFDPSLYLTRLDGRQQKTSTHTLNQTTWVAFRLGWSVKALHTIYDSLSFNGENDKPCALVLADYKGPDYNGHIGVGFPPLLEALCGHEQCDKVREFGRQFFLSLEGTPNVLK
jgi:hypothetical protein